MSAASTPISNENNSNYSRNPAILNISDLNDTSNSVFYDVPLDNQNSDSVLCGNLEDSGTSLKKKLYPTFVTRVVSESSHFSFCKDQWICQPGLRF